MGRIDDENAPQHGALTLNGKVFVEGMKCDPDPSPKTMLKMAASGAAGAIAGGVVMSWLRDQSWFWQTLHTITSNSEALAGAVARVVSIAAEWIGRF